MFGGTGTIDAGPGAECLVTRARTLRRPKTASMISPPTFSKSTSIPSGVAAPRVHVASLHGVALAA
jgi:hypothetical protein